MNIKKITAFLATNLAFFVINTGLAFAEVKLEPNVPASVQGPEVSVLVANVVSTLSFIAGTASVIAIIVGGIMYITSAGSDTGVKRAKDTVLYAVIGLIIAISAYAIANAVTTSILK